MAEKKFEESMKRLEKIVEMLENGELSLEESLKHFEEGIKLVTDCQKKLEQAEQKVTMLIKESDGSLKQKPFEVDNGK